MPCKSLKIVKQCVNCAAKCKQEVDKKACEEAVKQTYTRVEVRTLICPMKEFVRQLVNITRIRCI